MNTFLNLLPVLLLGLAVLAGGLALRLRNAEKRNLVSLRQAEISRVVHENHEEPARSRESRAERAQIRRHLLAMQKMDGNLICAGCGLDFRPNQQKVLDIDHIVPFCKGGSNEFHNRILLCVPCNRTKGKTHTLESLRDSNEKYGYMENRDLAEQVQRKLDLLDLEKR